MDGSVTLTVNKSSSVSSQLKHNYGKAIRLIQSKSNHQLSVHIVSKPRFNLPSTPSTVLKSHETASLNNRRPNALYRWYFRSQDDVMLVRLRSKPIDK
jgi:predicted metallopeptidase